MLASFDSLSADVGVTADENAGPSPPVSAPASSGGEKGVFAPDPDFFTAGCGDGVVTLTLHVDPDDAACGTEGCGSKK